MKPGGVVFDKIPTGAVLSKKNGKPRKKLAAKKVELPEFPWPPPEASAKRPLEIGKLVEDPTSATLGDLDASLRASLTHAGYTNNAYFGVPDGFALVTHLEQIEESGAPKPDPPRWSLAPERAGGFSLGAYLRALLTAQPGFFRVVVFVVTPVPFATSGARVDAAQALAWLQEGLDRLPESLAVLPLAGAPYAATALVYEFERRSTADEPKIAVPGRLSADRHLEAAGLLEELTR